MSTAGSIRKSMLRFLARVLLVLGLVALARPAVILTPASALLEQAETPSIEYVNSIGGEPFAIATQAQRVYLGRGNRLEIYDAGHPDYLFRRGSLAFSGLVEDIDLAGDLAYLASGISGLQIVDVSDPDQPRVVGVFDEPGGNALAVSVEGDRAYLAEGNFEAGSLQILDVSQPEEPQLLGKYLALPPENTLFASVRDVEAVGNTVYVIVWFTDWQHGAADMTILDASDPANPLILSSMDAGESSMMASTVEVNAGFAYLIPSIDSFGKLVVVDVRDPAHPKPLSWQPPCAVRDIFLEAAWAYLACTDQLLVLDMQDPAAPVVFGSLPAEKLGRLSATGGLIFSVGLRGHVYPVVLEGFQLQAFDVSNPIAPQLVYRQGFPPSWSVRRVQEDRARMFATRYEETIDRPVLDILDIRNASRPAWIGSFPGNSFASDIEAVGSLAYLAAGSGLQILDLSDPAHPLLLGSYMSPYGAASVEVVGSIAYLSENSATGLNVIDVSDPRHPVLIGGHPELGAILGLQVVGNLAFLSGYDGLRILDVGDPAEPVVLALYAGAGHFQVVGNQVYAELGGLEILDISDPASPALLGKYPASWTVEGLSVQDGYAAIITSEWELLILDVRDPQNPTLKAQYRLPDGSRAIHSARQYLYVSNQAAGLQVLWFGLPVSTLLGSGGGELISAPDGTQYTFPPGVFSSEVQITHTPRYPGGEPGLGLVGIGHVFEVQGEVVSSGASAQPAIPYTVTVSYAEVEVGSAIETTLALYWWDGSNWVLEPSSLVDPMENQVTAQIDHFGHFAVLGETLRTYLPFIRGRGLQN